MAGTPKKRAARAESAGVVDIAAPRAPMREALPTEDQPASPNARAHDARAGAGAGARARSATRRSMPAGPAMRGAVDSVQSRHVQSLAAALGSATVVRIERLQPRWCAGWVDDYPIEGAALGELLQYIRDEWGGALYLVSPLGVDGAVIFDAKVPIAGMPKDCGRVIDRDVWEGRATTPATVQQPTHAPPAAVVQGFDPGLVLGILKDANRAQFEAVKEMRASDSRQMAELIQSINRRTEASAAPRGPSFAEQIGEVVQSARALEKMREAIAVEPPAKSNAGDDTEPDVLKEGMRAAVTQMFTGAMQNQQAAQASARQPGPHVNGRARPMREAPSEGRPQRPKAQA